MAANGDVIAGRAGDSGGGDGGEDDHALLHRFVSAGDEAAFGLLVRRHLPRVYSSARRQVRDAALADDVTQAVFILLAKKAATLRRDAVLAAWLLKVTYLASRTALRAERRRRNHERRAAATTEPMHIAPAHPESPTDEQQQLRRMDAAMAEL